MSLELAISPCPNDTFTFHGLLTGAVRVEGETDVTIALADVQQLNAGLAAGRWDAAKASFAAALRLARECVVLSAGSALGFGVGPLLLAAPGRARTLDARGLIPARARVLLPGEHTTAHLLYRLFHAGEGSVEQVPFSTILPALARGEADFGVCIHEGRFTWQRYGLEFVQDVGAAWERHANSPLPLGGIVARKRLGRARLLALDRAVRASLDYARSHPDDAFRTMREHAQELEDEALWKHVELYVNAWTRDLGTEGREALRRIASCARVSGWIREDATGLEVLEPG